MDGETLNHSENMQSEQVNELFTALSKAQAMMGNAPMDGFNPHFKSKFATLKSITQTSRDPLSKNGLCVVQTFSNIDGEDYVITVLGHSSGQFITSKCPIRSKDKTSQAFGSGVTYARRYALGAILGMVTDEDDDGEASMERNGNKNGVKLIADWQKKKINDFMAKLPESRQAALRQWVEKEGFESIAKISADFFPEFIKMLERAAKEEEEALPY